MRNGSVALRTTGRLVGIGRMVHNREVAQLVTGVLPHAAPCAPSRGLRRRQACSYFWRPVPARTGRTGLPRRPVWANREYGFRLAYTGLYVDGYRPRERGALRLLEG